MTSNQPLAADGQHPPVEPEEGKVKKTAATNSIDGPSLDAGLRPVHSFQAMSGGLNEVIIEHEGHQYRLRATRNGRLLLNK